MALCDLLKMGQPTPFVRAISLQPSPFRLRLQLDSPGLVYRRQYSWGSTSPTTNKASGKPTPLTTSGRRRSYAERREETPGLVGRDRLFRGPSPTAVRHSPGAGGPMVGPGLDRARPRRFRRRHVDVFAPVRRGARSTAVSPPLSSTLFSSPLRVLGLFGSWLAEGSRSRLVDR